MKIKSILIIAVSVFIFSCQSPKNKIYQWRGEDRKGIFPETNLLSEWPENGPTEIWFLDGIGNGYGSPTVTDNEIFITGEMDSLAYLFCIDFDGKLRWKVPFGDEWIVSYPGSRSAPTIVNDFIYVGTGIGNLYCLKKENGEQVWMKDFTKDFAGQYPRFGHSEAPLVDGNKVFWTPGGQEYNVVALDRFTGDLIWWNKGFGERSGYNPGTLIKLPNRHIFVTFSAYKMMGFDTETGELLWTHAQTNTPDEEKKPGIGDTHSNCVIYENGNIYYAAGDGNGGVKLQLSDDGNEIKEIWNNKGFDSYMGAILKIDDYLYGTGTSKKYLKSVSAETGTTIDSLQLGWGAIIATNNQIYYYSQNGNLSLVDFENGKLKETSQFKINRGSGEHFSHPVIQNGILYQRHGNTLMAFDIRKIQPKKS